MTPPFDLEVRERPSRGDLDVAELREVRRRPDDRHRLRGLVPVGEPVESRGRSAPQLHADHAGRRGEVLDGGGVSLGEVRPLQYVEEALARREAREAEFRDDDRVGAQLSHQRFELIAEPAHQRGHADDRRHADDDAEDRQEGAKLVGAERAERHGDDLGEQSGADGHGRGSGRAVVVGWNEVMGLQAGGHEVAAGGASAPTRTGGPRSGRGGRLHGGPHAEEDADEAREAEAQGEGPPRERHGEPREHVDAVPIALPSRTPRMPPIEVNTTASMRNCTRISRRRRPAPCARRSRACVR